MELVKQLDNLEFVYEDVTFYIRPIATAKDRFEIDMTGDWKDGKFEMSKGDFFLKLIELFVVNWKGVTKDGKKVPYSFKTFAELPNGKNDLILTLGGFIASKTGVLPEPDEKKEG